MKRTAGSIACGFSIRRRAGRRGTASARGVHRVRALELTAIARG
jgi:hypothetical protein